METFSNYCRYLAATKTIRTDTISELYNLLEAEDKLDAEEVIKLDDRLEAQKRLEREFLYAPAGSREKQSEEYKEILHNIYNKIKVNIDTNVSKLFPDSKTPYAFKIGSINNSQTYSMVNNRVTTLINSDAFKEIVVSTDKARVVDSILRIVGLVFEEITQYNKEDRLNPLEEGFVIYQEFGYLILDLIRTLDYSEINTESSQYSIQNMSNLLRFFPTIELKSFRISRDEEITLPNILSKEEAVLFSRQYKDIYRLLSPNPDTTITRPDYLFLIKTAQLLKQDPLFKDIAEVRDNVPSLMRAIPNFVYSDMPKIYRIISLFTTIQDQTKLVTNKPYNYTGTATNVGITTGALSWDMALTNAVLTDQPAPEDKIADIIISSITYSVNSLITDLARFMAHTDTEEYTLAIKPLIDKRYKILVYEIIDIIYDVISVLKGGRTDTDLDFSYEGNKIISGIETLYNQIRGKIGNSWQDAYSVVKPLRLPDRPFAEAGYTRLHKTEDGEYTSWGRPHRKPAFINVPLPEGAPGGMARPGDVIEDEWIPTAYDYTRGPRAPVRGKPPGQAKNPALSRYADVGDLDARYGDLLFNARHPARETLEDGRSWYSVLTNLDWLWGYLPGPTVIATILAGIISLRALPRLEQIRPIEAERDAVLAAGQEALWLHEGLEDEAEIQHAVDLVAGEYQQILQPHYRGYYGQFLYAILLIIAYPTYELIRDLLPYVEQIPGHLQDFLKYLIAAMIKTLIKALVYIKPGSAVLVEYVIYPLAHFAKYSFSSLISTLVYLLQASEEDLKYLETARSKQPYVPPEKRQNSPEQLRKQDQLDEQAQRDLLEGMSESVRRDDFPIWYFSMIAYGVYKLILLGQYYFKGDPVTTLISWGFKYDPDTDQWYTKDDYNS